MMEASVSIKFLFNFIGFSLSAFMAYIGLDSNVFLLFGMLLMIDYITGVWKAGRLGHTITSNKMKYGVISKMSLILIPLTLAICAKIIGADFKYVLDTGMMILVLSEFYSIIGNIYSIRTKDELPEYDVVAALGKKIRNILLRMNDSNDNA